MPLSNYERQKRWREKNRAIYNLKRRNARKNLTITESNNGVTPDAPLSKIEELRQLIARPAPAEPIKPMLFKDDYGRIISEHQWNTLQRLKAKARASGYVLDEYSQ